MSCYLVYEAYLAILSMHATMQTCPPLEMLHCGLNFGKYLRGFLPTVLRKTGLRPSTETWSSAAPSRNQR